ncbi:MAG: protein kinase [Candidatus Hadarchaeum sp.]
MSDEHKRERRDSETSVNDYVDLLCDEFEAKWRQGERPSLEEYLGRVDLPHRAKLLRELLFLELHYRKRSGDVTKLDDLMSRFPDHQSLVSEVFAAAITESYNSEQKQESTTPSEETTISFQTDCHKLVFHDRGGLGEVFCGEDSRLSRPMAVKFLHWCHVANPDALTQFYLEIEVTSRLDHPGVVPVYGMGETKDGRPFYAMRFVQGETLRKAIDHFHSEDWQTRGYGAWRLELHRLLEHLVAACETVAYAHNRGIIHRDIKPENIMLGKYGETLVVDWGLAQFVGRDQKAKASGEKTLMPSLVPSDSRGADTGAGTVGYIAPEQLPGSLIPATPACDIYSLGATLYTLVTGRPPFKSADGQLVWEKIRSGDFPRPRHLSRLCPPALEAICLKAMSLDPADRYGSAEELADDLRRFMAEEPVSCYHERLSERVVRLARRHRAWTLAVLFVVLMVCVSAIAFAMVSRKTAIHEQQLRTLADRKAEEAQRARLNNLFTTSTAAAEAYARAIDACWLRLQLLASDPELPNLLKTTNESHSAPPDWSAIQTWLVDHTSEYLVEGLADCWFINDRQGIQIARNPRNETIGQSFRYRSYFHGGDRDLTEEEARNCEILPTSHPTVSAAYKSRSDGLYRVSLSVPIWGSCGQNEPPLGVLAMSIPLHALTSHLGLTLEQDMELTLLDLGPDTLEGQPSSGLILEHPRLRPSLLDGKKVERIRDDGTLQRLRQLVLDCKKLPPDRVRPLISELRTLAIRMDYRDPLGSRDAPPSPAAFWPVVTSACGNHPGDAQWIVIIRETSRPRYVD